MPTDPSMQRSVSLPLSLWQRIDAMGGNRSGFIKLAIDEYLSRREETERIERPVDERDSAIRG